LGKEFSLAKFTRRQFLRGTAAAGLAGSFLAGADAVAVEPNRPIVKRVDVPLRRLPKAFHGYTVAQLSDFHFDPHFSAVPIRRAVQITNALHPDLIVLTGDFVTAPFPHRFFPNSKPAANAAKPCAKILAGLQAPSGVWAILGNHDVETDPDRVVQYLRDQSIQVLINQSTVIEKQGKRLWMCGTCDGPGESDIFKSLHGVPAGEPVILLAHEPDVADIVAQFSVDLQLSGHSHGGQVRLPLLGALYLPRLARKYPRGLRQIGSLTLYTNVGIGTMGLPIRWNCPPEITLFTLLSAG
jgi:predicted MPP superfamily phosphohydrolase